MFKVSGGRKRGRRSTHVAVTRGAGAWIVWATTLTFVTVVRGVGRVVAALIVRLRVAVAVPVAKAARVLVRVGVGMPKQLQALSLRVRPSSTDER